MGAPLRELSCPYILLFQHRCLSLLISSRRLTRLPALIASDLPVFSKSFKSYICWKLLVVKDPRHYLITFGHCLLGEERKLVFFYTHGSPGRTCYYEICLMINNSHMLESVVLTCAGETFTDICYQKSIPGSVTSFLLVDQ